MYSKNRKDRFKQFNGLWVLLHCVNHILPKHAAADGIVADSRAAKGDETKRPAAKGNSADGTTSDG